MMFFQSISARCDGHGTVDINPLIQSAVLEETMLPELYSEEQAT